MSSAPETVPDSGKQVDHAEAEKHIDHKVSHEHDAVFDEKAAAAAYKADAIEAENAEHNMTVLEAVKEYPMATFWAFVMSSTIVSSLVPFMCLPDRYKLTEL